jgi:hypothetical protein
MSLPVGILNARHIFLNTRAAVCIFGLTESTECDLITNTVAIRREQPNTSRYTRFSLARKPIKYHVRGERRADRRNSVTTQEASRPGEVYAMKHRQQFELSKRAVSV